ncbi:MAG TPA: heme-binding protein [Candidatus Paceibacterota bacterium]|nr:heme-binding protein [Candidatus Paceibacterota bacterium]
MKTLLWILLVIIIILVVWSLVGYFSSRVEQTEYSIVKKANGYEIRNYPAHIVAQTTVQGSYQDSLNQGFRIVAGYIFGGNTKKESIAMTAPVTSQGGASQTIAMTAPVTANVDGNSHTISFGMPRSYTLATLPTPNDPRVKLVEVPAQKMAVLTFSWYATDSRVQAMEGQLLAELARDKVTVAGKPQYAGYNAPWTPPWMTRNEVMVAVQ